MTLALAILGLLSALVGAWVKFYKPKPDATLQDKLADADAELAARDGGAVNTRLERTLRLLNEPGGGDPRRPDGGADARGRAVPPGDPRVVRAGRADAGNPPPVGREGG